MSEILEFFKAYEFKGGSKPWFNVLGIRTTEIGFKF